jgi:hypothetical protein
MPAYAGICLLPEKQLGEKTLNIPEATEWQKAGIGLLGVNVLYHLDDDIFWGQSHASSNIGKAGITTLRFPGGELADNYDWETHSLEQPQSWPVEAATRAMRERRTDYKEFLSHAHRLGVQNIFFVVNLDGAFRAPGPLDVNLARYADKAARWVKAVKETGNRVQYWEIGNETYLPAGFPLSSREYAKALNIFAKAMRAADPTIMIGASGPRSVQTLGFADRIGEEGLRRFRMSGSRGKKACGGLPVEDCIARFASDRGVIERPEPWWPTLVKEAGRNFDFAVIHRYNYAIEELANLGMTKKIKKLKKYLHEATGRTIPIALTEWNTPNEKKSKPLTEMAQLLDIAVQLGNNAAGGVEFAHYWPMHLPDGGFKPLTDKHGNLAAVGRLFSLFAEVMTGSEVSEFVLTERVYVLRTRRTDGTGYIFVNTNSKAVRVKLDNLPGGSIRVSRIAGDHEGKVLAVVECTENIPKMQIVGLELPKESIAFIRH